MAAEKEGPAGPFKRVLALTMKTVALDPELQVTFGSEQPGLSGHRARLPQLSRDLNRPEVEITRGLADSMALRLANHRDDIHAKYRPEGKSARAVFEAVEQARVEAIGANAMQGMRSNLAAMLSDR